MKSSFPSANVNKQWIIKLREASLDVLKLYDQTHDLISRSNPEVVGSIPTEVKRSFSLPRVVP